MQRTFKVPNIGCDGCVKTVKLQLSDLAGVKYVEGEVESQMVTVEWDDPANWEQIAATLTEIEYPPEA